MEILNLKIYIIERFTEINDYHINISLCYQTTEIQTFTTELSYIDTSYFIIVQNNIAPFTQLTR